MLADREVRNYVKETVHRGDSTAEKYRTGAKHTILRVCQSIIAAAGRNFLDHGPGTR